MGKLKPEEINSQYVFAPCRAIIADDVRANRDFLYAVLASCGFELEVAANTKELLDKVDEFKPALLIIDLKTPQINGLEAARLIKQKKRKCVLLSFLHRWSISPRLRQ